MPDDPAKPAPLPATPTPPPAAAPAAAATAKTKGKMPKHLRAWLKAKNAKPATETGGWAWLGDFVLMTLMAGVLTFVGLWAWKEWGPAPAPSDPKPEVDEIG